MRMDALEKSPPDLQMSCAECGKSVTTTKTKKGKPRLLTGAKRLDDATAYCKACWKKRYILRAISMPVASPLTGDWDTLWDAVKAGWKLTTACSNRILTELYANDVRRGPKDIKMPNMPHVYLYPMLRSEFPGLPSQVVSGLEHAITAKYKAVRYKVIWTGQASLPVYRYPTPLPIPNQGWSCRIENNQPIVSFRIGEGERFELRLKTGPQFYRQMASFSALVNGTAIAGAAAICKKGQTLMVKLVAWQPRQTRAEVCENVLRVVTRPDCLLLAVNAKDAELWRIHGNNVLRWAAEHRKRLKQWADDQKQEQRPVPSFADRRAAAIHKFRDRMDTATHEFSAQVAGYALRRRFSKVVYDDKERSYLPDFPWFRLASLIAEKLDAYGIAFEMASTAAEPENGEPLAEAENS